MIFLIQFFFFSFSAAVHIYLLPLLGLSLAALQLSEAASTIGVCYSKPDNTILAVEGSCTTYIYCLTEQAIVLPCPNGTAFSSSARGCIEKSQADCFLQVATTTDVNSAAACVDNEKRPENQAACAGQLNGALVAYPGNCSLYLVCNCEYPTVMTCSGGTWFNPDKSVCDWPQNVPSCGGTGSTQVTNTPPSSTTQTTEIPSEKCKDIPAGLVGTECVRMPDDTLIRYPYNCNAYINCTLACPVLNYCVQDKVFNDKLNICDTPDTAHCIELELPTTTESTTSTTQSTTTTTESTTTPTPTTTTTTERTTSTSASTITVPTAPTRTTKESTTPTTLAPCIPPVGIEEDICQNQNDRIYGYPYNCSEYIKCADGCPLLHSCLPNLIYNSVLEICDKLDSAYCKEEPLPTAAPPPVTLPPNVDDMCTNKPNGTILPYENDCASFIQCINGKPLLQQCPTNWLFNPDLLVCDLAKDVNCYSQTTSTTSMPTTNTPVYELCIGQEANVKFPDITNCQQYYVCGGDDTYMIFPCPENNYYNPYSGDCGPAPGVSPTACKEPLTTSTATTSTTQNPATMCKDQDSGKTYPIATSCNQYYYCINSGPPEIFECPHNNYYNPLSGDCGPNPSVCQPSVTTTTSIPTTSTSTGTPTTSTQTTTTPPLTNICSNSIDGDIWPYPDSCTKYIVCQQPAPVALECPNDWYFNAATKQCDFPQNVTCNIGPITTTTTTSPGGSTTTTTTTTAGPIDNTCMGLPEGQRLPYDKNCQLFIECLGSNLWMYKSCPAGEYYDAMTSNCRGDVGPTACQAPPTVAPTVPPTGPCAGVSDGSMVPYPNNCTKYIICQSPIPIGQDCGLGFEFNAAMQQCTTVESAECSIKTTTTVITSTTIGSECLNASSWETFPYPDDCSKYIVCSDGKQQIVPCVSGYYNLDTRRCEVGVSETCCTGNGNCATATTDSTGTPTMSPGTTTTVSTPGFPMGPCYKQPDGMLVEYPNNCSKYIICVMPIPIGYDCQPDLEFNSESMRCEAPELANCGIKTSLPMSSSTTTTLSTSTISPTTVTTPPSTICQNATNGDRFPYPPDCSKYIVCINGAPMTAICINGSYYNPASSACEQISDTACREPVDPTTISTTPEKTTATSEITTTLNPYTPNICCGIPLGTLIPYPNACDRYVKCAYPVPIVINCSSGQLFDSKQAKCVPAAESQCVSSGTHDNVNETTLDPPKETTTEINLRTTLDPAESTTGVVHTTTSDTTSVTKSGTTQDPIDSSFQTTLDPTYKTTLGSSTLDPVTEATSGSTTGATANLNTGATWEPTSGTSLNTTPGATTDPTAPVTTPDFISPTAGTTLKPTSGTTFDSTPRAATDPTTPVATSDSTLKITSDITSGTTLDSTLGPTSATTVKTVTSHPTETTGSAISTSDPTFKTPKKPATTLDPTSVSTQDHSTLRTTKLGTTSRITSDPPLPTTTTISTAETTMTSKITTTSSTSLTTPRDYATMNLQSCVNAAPGTQKQYFGDCTKYNFCFGNQSMVLSCNQNWYYNPTLKECVPKSYYNCPF